MTTGMNRETATIIPFPIRNRMAAVAKYRNARLVEEANAAPIHDYGSWYHEEAIAEISDIPKPRA